MAARVYDADGGWRGEAAYVVGALLGRAHCALCDITHSPVRRKRAWDAMVGRLPLPMRVVHRNEVPEQLVTAVRQHRLAAVFLVHDRQVELLVDADELARLGGSVDEFEALLAARLVGGVGEGGEGGEVGGSGLA